MGEFIKDILVTIVTAFFVIMCVVGGNVLHDRFYPAKERPIIFNYKCEVKTNVIQPK